MMDTQHEDYACRTSSSARKLYSSQSCHRCIYPGSDFVSRGDWTIWNPRTDDETGSGGASILFAEINEEIKLRHVGRESTNQVEESTGVGKINLSGNWHILLMIRLFICHALGVLFVADSTARYHRHTTRSKLLLDRWEYPHRSKALVVSVPIGYLVWRDRIGPKWPDTWRCKSPFSALAQVLTLTYQLRTIHITSFCRCVTSNYLFSR